MNIFRLFAPAVLACTLAGCAASQKATPPASTATSTTTSASAAAAAGGTRTVKSIDGTFDGEIVGTPAPNSKFAKLQIGMRQRQVEELIGPPSDEDGHITGKAFGGDTHRIEAFYKNEGQLTYSPPHFGGTANVLIRIIVDPKANGYAH